MKAEVEHKAAKEKRVTKEKVVAVEAKRVVEVQQRKAVAIATEERWWQWCGVSEAEGMSRGRAACLQLLHDMGFLVQGELFLCFLTSADKCFFL